MSLKILSKPFARQVVLYSLAILGVSSVSAYVIPGNLPDLSDLIGSPSTTPSCCSQPPPAAPELVSGLKPATSDCCLGEEGATIVVEDCCAPGISRAALLVADQTEIEAEADEPPTYHKDIVPLLQRHCQECHRSDRIGPFPLMTYEQSRKRAFDLATVTEDRRMPPWKASHSDFNFANDRSLTRNEIELLAAWADAGAPEGNPANAPPPVEFSEGWTLGTPDLIVEMPEAFTIPASGDDIYRCFVIPTNFEEDVQVIALEYQPGNPRVVHHILGYVDSSGEGYELAVADSSAPGYECFGGPMIEVQGDLGGWAPGANADSLPEGVGRILPKNSHIIMQVHYHPSGKEETDRSRLGLYFASKDQPIKQAFHWWFSTTFDFKIPPGAKDYEVNASTIPFPTDLQILKVSPHMHLLGRQMTMTAVLPDGTEHTLIHVDDWDFNWQLQYQFEEPIDLPQGSVVKVRALYDNSADNPHQPVPEPQEVTYGDATTDEMCFGFFGVVKQGQDLTQPGQRDDLLDLLREEYQRLEAEARRQAESAAGEE